MSRFLFTVAFAISFFFSAGVANTASTTQYGVLDLPDLSPEVYNMNSDWKFFQPPRDQKQGPLSNALVYMKRGNLNFYDIAYDDTSWETVSIPHPFNACDMYQNRASSGGDRGIYQGIVFYRKHFTLPKDATGKKVFIEFEGIRMAAYVYLNGELLGYYEAGVSAFGFDLSADNLYYDKPNVLAVAVDNRGAGNTTGNPAPANNNLRETKPGSPAGAGNGSGFQWSGMDFNPVQGGLNRNVKLYIKNTIYQTLPLYRNLRTQGTYVYPSEIDVSARTAVINVEADVRNESSSDKNISLDVVVVDRDGKISYQFGTIPQDVPRATDTNKNAEINITAVPADYSRTEEGVDLSMRQTTVIKAAHKVDNIKLWSPDAPNLYDVYAILKDGNKVIDVVKITTGFRKAEYRGGLDGGVYINDRFTWLTGYAQRSTNEWAAIGTANDWLHDYEMSIVRESNANFIRWMHISPPPSVIRSGDRYGVVSVVPAGDKENGNVDVRQWNQRLETMRDVMIYFRNCPSVLFWETGNSAVSAGRMKQMTELRRQLDPLNMRVMGCRSLEQISAAEASEWVGTMLGRRVNTGGSNYTGTGRQLIDMRPIVESEYTRDEAPRRVWDRFSPPDFDYRNYFSGNQGATPTGNRDAWDYTQEEFVVANVAAYNEFYSRMINSDSPNPMYAAAAALCWSDSNQHGRQTATETGRMSGRVDAVRIKKPSYFAYQAMQAKIPTVYLVGHWNYPTNYEDYKYFVRNDDFTYSATETALRDAANKTIYAVASNVASVELFVNGVSRGVNNQPRNNFLYQWNGIDVTKNGNIYAVGYDETGKEVTKMKIETAGAPVGLRLTPVTGPDGLRADGSDIAYFDVEVIDAQGRVCPLSFDKINFSLKGPATIMGGYNSGSHIIPEWAKGYNKSYIFAECGINRLFIKSGRETGDIILTANIDGGQDFSTTIKSVPFEATKGLTKVMPQTMLPDVNSFSVGSVSAENVTVKSPQEALVCIVETDHNGHLSYSIEFNKQKIVLPSAIGIIVDDDDLGSAAALGDAKTKTVNESYPIRGVHSVAKNNYNEAIIPVTGGENKTAWTLELRVFPDAVAYRYRVPGNGKRRIAGESSSWQMIGGTTMWYQTTAKKDYEMPFFTMMTDTISQPFEIMTTSTFKLPNGLGYAKISEANLINYSDMALKTTGNGYFKPVFHNSTQGWDHEGEILSPWRTVIITPDLNGLVNTDVFHNLSPAPSPELVNAEWIRPGKSTWAWMVTGSPALRVQKKWIDWTSELEFEYYLIDDGWAKWNNDGKDQWQHIKELVDYAKTKNVDLWAWVHSREVKTQEQRKEYFRKAKEAGLAGLKIDFMGAANPEWVQWYDDVLREIAEYRLMVNFHGANKPTGRERTWPHEMTREGIRGREMGKQPALHDTSLPFTRFVHGHADYTPTDFRADKLKGSTWTHELAMSVIFTSPLFVMAGGPVTYLESDALGFMKALPAEWDETVVLPDSEIGSLAAFARRKGDEWYIGIINGTATSITVKTDFLSKGEYTIEEFRDINGKTDAWEHKTYNIDQNSNIEILLNRDGGYVAKIKK